MNLKDGRCLKKYYCIDCGEEISISSKLYGKGRCKSCCKKGNLHYANYRGFSKKHKINISKNHANVKGNKNGNYKHGETLKQHYCQKCGKIICYNNWKNGSKLCFSCAHKGERCIWYGKVTHGKWGVYKRKYMRSSYEIKFAYFLDCSGIKWLYEPKAFDLGNSTYRPDFYLPEFDCYIEIKGYWREDAKKKYRQFKKKYSDINIKILNQKKLLELGVLYV